MLLCTYSLHCSTRTLDYAKHRRILISKVPVCCIWSSHLWPLGILPCGLFMQPRFVLYHVSMVCAYTYWIWWKCNLCLIDFGCPDVYPCFKSFMITYGILHQSSCPYTPQQTGITESKYWHIVETACTLLLNEHAPLKF